jgi:dolichol-phosphate mannosyltransferase
MWSFNSMDRNGDETSPAGHVPRTEDVAKDAALAGGASRQAVCSCVTDLLTPFRRGREKVRTIPVGNRAAVWSDGSVCVCVPTYNEVDNVEAFVNALLVAFDQRGIDGCVLVVDDASPDGTGELADRLSERDRRVQVLHRARKDGIGRAYPAGFSWALDRGFDLVAQMDCDFSHDPASLCDLLEATRHADLAIGSRYVAGGRVCGWPLPRRLISRWGCWYARTLLGLPLRDLTGGFKCFRRQGLAQIAYEQAAARGYGFQIETTYLALRAGLRVIEVPIVFRDRTAGRSKMSVAIALEAAVLVFKLRLRPNPATSMRRTLRERPVRGPFRRVATSRRPVSDQKGIVTSAVEPAGRASKKSSA